MTSRRKRGSQLAFEILDFDWLIENVFCALETTVRFFVVKLTTPILLQLEFEPPTAHGNPEFSQRLIMQAI